MRHAEPDVQLFRDMIVRALEQEISPHYQDWEDAGVMPRAIWRTLGEAGLLGIDMPEEYGGAGAGFEISQMAVEEIARQGFGGLASGYNIHANIVMPYILHIGTEGQKRQWLPLMATGAVLGAIAMTEPGAGSDLAAMRTTVERTADGWRINGTKVFITNGMHADLVIVCAKTDPKAGAKGVSLFLVDARSPGSRSFGQRAYGRDRRKRCARVWPYAPGSRRVRRRKPPPRLCRNRAGALRSTQIVPVTVRQGRQEISFCRDEHPRAGTTVESLAQLKPVFKKDGIVTAGNASGLNDGAAALVLTSAFEAARRGLRPRTSGRVCL